MQCSYGVSGGADLGQMHRLEPRSRGAGHAVACKSACGLKCSQEGARKGEENSGMLQGAASPPHVDTWIHQCCL